jgi:hypothetical protein
MRLFGSPRFDHYAEIMNHSAGEVRSRLALWSARFQHQRYRSHAASTITRARPRRGLSPTTIRMSR